MNVLLVGGGGREAALAWALARSPRLTSLSAAPGNAGIGRLARRIPIAADDVPALAAHAIAERYDLVVIGPEAPLCGGLADRLRDAGLDVFGPSAAAARIEGSKAFAKELMARHGIPTAGFHIFDDADEARRYLAGAAYPLVVKADGLAAGKGVVIAQDPATAIAAAAEMLSGHAFGEAGRRVVVEEMLSGREASCFVLADGTTTLELAACQDYKRAGDGDRGPNTGGMGTYSPSVWIDERTASEVRERISIPTIRGLAEEGAPFHGVLFIGLMLTASGPKVLEFNARFGDPETQVLVPRLDGDWLELLAAAARGELRGMRARFSERAAVCVVMAAGGYPGGYAKGSPIEGLDEAASLADVAVFHAGTEIDDMGRVVTAGGRVLGVTALGDTIAGARDRAYEAVARIRWDLELHRTDIAADAISETAPLRPPRG
ncbi:MAG TPA: phosphoribosylamine--glycine ligase [Candidatus Polarisedimenticolaceae bacterium]|nr:phosphoribosylamine--glycine ligase [Candidatus Polarisedimenticolaceae bacterium]